MTSDDMLDALGSSIRKMNTPSALSKDLLKTCCMAPLHYCLMRYVMCTRIVFEAAVYVFGVDDLICLPCLPQSSMSFFTLRLR
jgi:hypothetical protein